MEKLRIKNMVNESHIKWLYETKKIVDDINVYSKNIVDWINENFNSTETYYKSKSSNKETINIPSKNFTYKCDIPYNSKQEVFITLEIYAFLCKNKDEIRLLKEKNMIGARLNYFIEEPFIYIGFEILNGKYNRKKLENTISHELTHYVQAYNNEKLKTADGVTKYNKQYKNITQYQLKQNDGINKDFAYICYFFTRSEISAKLSELYTELKNEGANAKNVDNLYLTTGFYEDYSDALQAYNNLLSLTYEWATFKSIAQSYEFFKENMQLSKVKDHMAFKNLFVKFINVMIKYTNDGIKIVLKKFK